MHFIPETTHWIKTAAGALAGAGAGAAALVMVSRQKRQWKVSVWGLTLLSTKRVQHTSWQSYVGLRTLYVIISPISHTWKWGERAYGYAQGDMVWECKETCTLLAHSFCCLLQNTAWGTHRPSAGAVWLCRTSQPTPAQSTTPKPTGPKHKNPKPDLTIHAPGIMLMLPRLLGRRATGKNIPVLLLSTLAPQESFPLAIKQTERLKKKKWLTGHSQVDFHFKMLYFYFMRQSPRWWHSFTFSIMTIVRGETSKHVLVLVSVGVF